MTRCNVIITVTLTILSLVTACIGQVDGVKQATRSAGEESPDAIKLFWKVKFRSSPILIPPIYPEEVTQYSRMLRLSDEQSQFVFEKLYPTYLIQTKEITLGPLKTVSEISTRPRLPEGEEALQNFREFIWARDEVASLYKKAEQRFFEQIKLLLSVEQLEMHERIVWHRARKWNVRVVTHLRAARIDLVSFIEKLELTPETWESIDAVLWDYEREVTPLMREMERVFSDLRIPIRELYIHNTMRSTQPESEESRQLRLEEHESERASLYAMEIDAQLKVRDANKKWFPRIEAALPANLQEPFRKKYEQFAWSHLIYPDKAKALPLCDAIVQLDSLADDTRVAVIEERATHERAYERICRKHEAKFDEMQEHHGRVRSSSPQGTLLGEEFRVLWTDRWGMNRDFALKLKGILPPEILLEFNDQIEKYLQRHEDVGKATLTPYFPETVL